MTKLTHQEILALPIPESDIGETTIGGYLAALLVRVWEDGEGFSGKRPFGNGGWQEVVYEALVKGGAIDGAFDADDLLVDFDEETADEVLIDCIKTTLGVSDA